MMVDQTTQNYAFLKQKYDIILLAQKYLRSELDHAVYSDLPFDKRKPTKALAVGPLFYNARLVKQTKIDKDAINHILQNNEMTLLDLGYTIDDLYKTTSSTTYRLNGYMNKTPLAELQKQLKNNINKDSIVTALLQVYRKDNEMQGLVDEFDKIKDTELTEEFLSVLGNLYLKLRESAKLIEHDLERIKVLLIQSLGLGKHEGITIFNTSMKTFDKTRFVDIFPDIDIPTTTSEIWRSELLDKTTLMRRQNQLDNAVDITDAMSDSIEDIA